MISESTEDSFYITLSSDGSTNTYSTNTPSHFLNILGNRIQLNDSSWKVGLSEIHIPLTCYNVSRGQNIIRFKIKGYDEVKHKITPGYYRTIQQLLDELNKITPFITFDYSNVIYVSANDKIESLYY
jgi:hypothetical protein